MGVDKRAFRKVGGGVSTSAASSSNISWHSRRAGWTGGFSSSIAKLSSAGKHQSCCRGELSSSLGVAFNACTMMGRKWSSKPALSPVADKSLPHCWKGGRIVCGHVMASGRPLGVSGSCCEACDCTVTVFACCRAYFLLRALVGLAPEFDKLRGRGGSAGIILCNARALGVDDVLAISSGEPCWPHVVPSPPLPPLPPMPPPPPPPCPWPPSASMSLLAIPSTGASSPACFSGCANAVCTSSALQ
mmetsp:Transcript_23423/g.62581  ORF Transcript_23423/g.62581 Transcript_23423/m.62581 type:complete len:245 (+) Transcript_23423:961-1695(+)